MEVTLVSSVSVEAVFLFLHSIVGRYIYEMGLLKCVVVFIFCHCFCVNLLELFIGTQGYRLGDYWCLNLSLFLSGLLLFYGGSKHYRLCPIIYGHCQVLCRPCGAVYICVYTGCIEGFL